MLTSPLLKGLECYLVMVPDNKAMAAELALVANSLHEAAFKVITSSRKPIYSRKSQNK